VESGDVISYVGNVILGSGEENQEQWDCIKALEVVEEYSNHCFMRLPMKKA